MSETKFVWVGKKRKKEKIELHADDCFLYNVFRYGHNANISGNTKQIQLNTQCRSLKRNEQII